MQRPAGTSDPPIYVPRGERRQAHLALYLRHFGPIADGFEGFERLPAPARRAWSVVRGAATCRVGCSARRHRFTDTEPQPRRTAAAGVIAPGEPEVRAAAARVGRMSWSRVLWIETVV